jgi:AhpD family alkylhydroperoxidase
MPFLGQIMGESSLDLVTKEVVIMRVSQINGCRYCLAAHRPIAVEAGVPDAELAAVCGGDSQSLSPRSAAIVHWVDAVVAGEGAVTDELVARLLDHVRDHQLVELTILVGAITMLNQYCSAFDIPPPGTDIG